MDVAGRLTERCACERCVRGDWSCRRCVTEAERASGGAAAFRQRAPTKRAPSNGGGRREFMPDVLLKGGAPATAEELEEYTCPVCKVWPLSEAAALPRKEAARDKIITAGGASEPPRESWLPLWLQWR